MASIASKLSESRSIIRLEPHAAVQLLGTNWSARCMLLSPYCEASEATCNLFGNEKCYDELLLNESQGIQSTWWLWVQAHRPGVQTLHVLGCARQRRVPLSPAASCWRRLRFMCVRFHDPSESHPAACNYA